MRGGVVVVDLLPVRPRSREFIDSIKRLVDKRRLHWRLSVLNSFPMPLILSDRERLPPTEEALGMVRQPAEGQTD